MKQISKLAPIAIITAAAVFALAACGKKEEAAKAEMKKAEDVIKIGHVAPLTGGIAHLGKDNENGARMAVDEINAAGGIKLGEKSFKLELLAEDDKQDAKEATIVAQRLVDAGVVAVVGRDDKQGGALGDYASNALKAKTVAIIADRSAYGQGLADEFEKAIQAKGTVKVVAREFTNDKATDFNAILTKIRAVKPDVVMYGGMDNTAAPMAKQMKQLGIKAPLVAGDGVCTPEFITLAGDAAGIMSCSQAGEAVDKLAKGEEFKQKYKAKFGTDVQIYSPYSYDAVYAIADAIKRAGKPDRAAVTAALASSNLPGLTGTIAFDDKGDIKNGAISMFQVKDGKLEYVSTQR